MNHYEIKLKILKILQRKLRKLRIFEHRGDYLNSKSIREYHKNICGCILLMMTHFSETRLEFCQFYYKFKNAAFCCNVRANN